jgi:hypothetical protein
MENRKEKSDCVQKEKIAFLMRETTKLLKRKNETWNDSNNQSGSFYLREGAKVSFTLPSSIFENSKTLTELNPLSLSCAVLLP